MKIQIQVALLIFTLIHLTYSQEAEPPVLVVSLSRNGPREPVASEIDNSWMNSFELMDVGSEQNFMLGSLLAKRYSYLLQGITPSEMHLQASNRHSTQMSLSAQLLGLFQGRASEIYGVPMASKLPPFEDAEMLNQVAKELQEKPDSIPNRFQLLKPKVLETPDEDFLEVSSANCYSVLQQQKQRYHGEVAAQMMNDFSETIQKLQGLGYNITHIRGLAQLGDILESRFIANKTELNGIKYGGRLYNDTVFIYKWWSFYNSVGNETERSLKLFPFYTQLVHWFTIRATTDIPLKFVLLNGHKSILFSMLSMYNITNHQCLYENYKNEKAGKPLQYPDCTFPQYGSQLIFEFTRSRYQIKALYDGKPVKICKSSSEFECHISTFIQEKNERFLEVPTKEDFKRACATPIPQIQTPPIPIDPYATPVSTVIPTAPLPTLEEFLATQEPQVDLSEEQVHDIEYIPPPLPPPTSSKSQEFVTNTSPEAEEASLNLKSLVLLKSRIVNGLSVVLIVLIIILLYIIYLAMTHKLVMAKNVASNKKKDFIPVIEMPNPDLEETGDSDC